MNGKYDAVICEIKLEENKKTKENNKKSAYSSFRSFKSKF